MSWNMPDGATAAQYDRYMGYEGGPLGPELDEQPDPCVICRVGEAYDASGVCMSCEYEAMDARAWMESFSSAGRLAEPARREEPSGRPRTMVAEQWDGQKWIERRLVWNGTVYVDAVPQEGKVA